jgi:hypothetical protein
MIMNNRTISALVVVLLSRVALTMPALAGLGMAFAIATTATERHTTVIELGPVMIVGTIAPKAVTITPEATTYMPVMPIAKQVATRKPVAKPAVKAHQVRYTEIEQGPVNTYVARID